MTAKDFIVGQIARHARNLALDVTKSFSADYQVEIELTGECGDVFHLYWVDGALHVGTGKAAAPLVSVNAPAHEFLGLMTLASLSHFKFNPIAMLSPEKIALVKKLTGTLCVKVCEGASPQDHNISSVTFLAFNGEPVTPAAPRCTVLMPLTKLEQLADGRITATQLVVEGGLCVSGDLQMLWLLAPLVI